MDINNVMIVEGASQYGAMSVFNRELADGFADNGINAFVLSMKEFSETDFCDKLSEADIVFSLNGMGINDIIKLQELVNRFDVPCWSFMVDHPYCHHTRLINAAYSQIVSVIDRKHLEYLEQYYPNMRYKFFLPHGGACSEYASIKFDDKKYELSFFGSYEAADESLGKLGNYSKDLQEIFIKVVEDVWNCKESTLEDSFRHNMAQYKIDVGEDEVAEFMFELNFLDTYLRFERRSLLIETALRSGRKVHVFGKGWENFQCSNSQDLVVHGEVDYKTSLDIMADSKVVLNNMPLFADGSHERVFSILASGSICLTDANPYLKETFTHGEDLFYYDWKNIDELPDIINSILDRAYDVDKIIDSGKSKAVSSNMWRDRARQIIEYCKGIEFGRHENIYSDPIDRDMYSLFDYIDNTEKDVLYEQIKGRYNWYTYYEEDYIEALNDFMNRYRLLGEWEPENDNYGIIKKRVDVLKDHGKELVRLYESLGDHSSKLMLCNTLVYWVTFSRDRIFGMAEDVEMKILDGWALMQLIEDNILRKGDYSLGSFNSWKGN